MKRGGFLMLVAAALAWSSCDCGGVRPVGDPCFRDGDCVTGYCGANGFCDNRPKPNDGGEEPVQDAGRDAGPPLLPDGGVIPTLPDGGPCENLQCQVAVCPDAGTTTVVGKVYDPAGQVPLYNAIVYVPNRPVKPFPAGPSCSACGALVSGSPVAITLTGPDGTFTLKDVPAGVDIPLVMQIGKWRRQVTLPAVAACQSNPVTDANVTRLPRNRTEGELPQMALSSGNADAFECLLRKMGISDSEFTAPAGGGKVHFYKQNGMDLATPAPAGVNLWADAGTLMAYDVVMLPCEGAENTKDAGSVQNVVAYANAGGRVFATHYSYVWTRPGWPQAADWRPGLGDLYNSVFNVTVDQSFPKGQAFSQWLYNVNASQDAGTLGIRESRHDVVSVKPGATRWLYGDVPSANPQASVQHLTFNTPFVDGGVSDDAGVDGGVQQCGRVVFSDFHVTAGATDGGNTFPAACATGPLTAQEKALLFMLFDLSACVQDDTKAPMACVPVGQSCVNDGQCCEGLACRGPNLAPCTGAGCSCVVVIN